MAITLTEPQEKLLKIIRNKYNLFKGSSLSVEYLLTQTEYVSVVASLLTDYPSVQATYNVGCNENKVLVKLGII